MTNLVKFPVNPENKEKLDFNNKKAKRDESYKTKQRKSFLSILFRLLKINKVENTTQPKNVVHIGIEKKPEYINPVIQKMYTEGNYTVNHFSHYIFNVNGEIYTIGVCELEMMGIK